MAKAKNTPAGYLAFTLHAHLPYVVNHGTWPHGMEWLHEAAAETYLPILRMLGNLERDGVPANFNINLSPVLLEQLAHPFFIAEFPKYLTRKILAAREDEAYFIQSGDAHLTETARFWGRFFSAALDDFNALDGNIVSGFRHFNDAGLIEIITCAATHGYLPLLGTDESVRAQVRTAVSTHIRHLGKPPRGIWAPECGYRPAGFWDYPVPPAGATEPSPGFERIGVEQALSESGLDYFFVDSHLIEECYRVPSPYGAPNSRLPRDPGSSRRPTSRSAASIRPITSTGRTTSATRPPSFPAIQAPACRCGRETPATPATPTTSTSTRSDSPAAIATGRSPARASTWATSWSTGRIRPPSGSRSTPTTSSTWSMTRLSPDSTARFLRCCARPSTPSCFGHWWFEGPMWLEQALGYSLAHAAGPVRGDGGRRRQ